MYYSALLSSAHGFLRSLLPLLLRTRSFTMSSSMAAALLEFKDRRGSRRSAGVENGGGDDEER